MAGDFGKILEKIKQDNTALKKGQEKLCEAFEKLDARLTQLNAGVRVEPYATTKDGALIGFMRFSDGWHITTHLEGIGGIISEAPATEAPAARQVELMPHVAGLLEKISSTIADRVKSTTGALTEADKLISALRQAG